jgi:FkbM family methyltransferase
LKKNSENDDKWSIHNFALGNFEGTTTIHIAENSFSSSILNILPAHVESAPESRYISDCQIQIHTLDNVFQKLVSADSKTYLKIDTQGFEKNVLEGAAKSLEFVNAIQLELSLIPLYENESLAQEMIQYLKERGFILQLIEQGHSNYNTGEILQIEAYFFRSQI